MFDFAIHQPPYSRKGSLILRALIRCEKLKLKPHHLQSFFKSPRYTERGPNTYDDLEEILANIRKTPELEKILTSKVKDLIKQNLNRNGLPQNIRHIILLIKHGAKPNLQSLEFLLQRSRQSGNQYKLKSIVNNLRRRRNNNRQKIATLHHGSLQNSNLRYLSSNEINLISSFIRRNSKLKRSVVNKWAKKK